MGVFFYPWSHGTHKITDLSSGSTFCCSSHLLSESQNEETFLWNSLSSPSSSSSSSLFTPFYFLHPPSPIPLSLSSSPPCHRVCVETQPTVQQMNNLAVCVSSVYRANPSVSRHLSIRACLVIVHPRHTRTHTNAHTQTHTHALLNVHTHAHLCIYMMCKLAHIQIL